MGQKRCTSSAREQPPRMFTIPPRQRLSATIWLAVPRWNVIHELELSSLIQKRYMGMRRVPTSFDGARSRREKKRNAKQKETQILNANSSRHKKTRTNTYIMHSKKQKAKRKYLAPPRLRWYLHTQLLMRPNVTYLPCADGNGSIPRRMSARCQ